MSACQLNESGIKNTAVGAKAPKKSTGQRSVGIGYQAGVSLMAGKNNSYVGDPGAVDEALTMRLVQCASCGP